MKLLITDDQNSVHMYFDRMIPYEKLGITEVFHAKNGEEALALIQEKWPEILILDIRMPVMDGLKLLEKLEEFQWDHQVLILSAYNEFEYARKCIIYGVKNYLLKPIDNQEVTATLKKAIRELAGLKQAKFARLLSEFLVRGEGQALPEVPGELCCRGYGVVCYKNQEETSSDQDLAKELFSVTTEGVDVCIFQAEDEAAWKRFYEWQKGQGTKSTVGFSRYHETPAAFWDSVREGLEAVNQGFYRMGTYYYQEDAMNIYQGKEGEYLSEQLKKSWKGGEIEVMKQAVERLFFVFQRGNVHPRHVQEFCYGFLLQLDQNFMETLKKLKGSSFTSQFVYSDAAGLKSTFLRLMISMRCDIAPEEVQMDTDVVNRIRHYIDTNYEKDLSLATLAKHFFISKYQISRLFKKQFEINYSDYILKVRMEAAGMMLKTSGDKIEEIARRSGFEEISYFSRVFSKYYGVSPGEYRKKE